MNPFRYDRPSDVAGAVALLSRPGSKALAGGTNLVDLMKLGVERPEHLVDVNHLGLDGLEETAAGLRVGAGVRNSDLAAAVRDSHPVLSQALLSAASGQLRNSASLGGNLLQRTRCVYFMDPTTPCNKREPGTGCSAFAGTSRELAVLGTSEHCLATAPGDMAVALSALDAVVHLEGPAGELAINDLYRLPGDTPQRDTELPAGALITAVTVPTPIGRSAYRKARDRASYAFALAAVAAVLDVRDGVVHRVAISWGAVAHKPWRARVAEELLTGGPASAAAFRTAVDVELEQATPQEDNAFKVELLRRLTVATLLELSA